MEDPTGRDPSAVRREASPDQGTTHADDAALGAVGGSAGKASKPLDRAQGGYGGARRTSALIPARALDRARVERI